MADINNQFISIKYDTETFYRNNTRDIYMR